MLRRQSIAVDSTPARELEAIGNDADIGRGEESKVSGIGDEVELHNRDRGRSRAGVHRPCQPARTDPARSLLFCGPARFQSSTHALKMLYRESDKLVDFEVESPKQAVICLDGQRDRVLGPTQLCLIPPHDETVAAEPADRR